MGEHKRKPHVTRQGPTDYQGALAEMRSDINRQFREGGILNSDTHSRYVSLLVSMAANGAAITDLSKPVFDHAMGKGPESREALEELRIASINALALWQLVEEIVTVKPH